MRGPLTTERGRSPDEGPALVTSLNFTRKCFNKTCDAILVTHDPAVVAGLRDLMAADRDSQPLPDTLPPRLIIGPERARRQITALLTQLAESGLRNASDTTEYQRLTELSRQMAAPKP